MIIGETLGTYRVLAKLGEGGMGEVYRATDVRLKRSVAIKVLPAVVTADRDRLVRFEREAQLLASLNHPNIAHVYGFEHATLADGSSGHFIAMELVEGEDLAERLTRGPIPLDEAIAIARQMVDAIEEAHERGIVHRDLKPANVKVTPDGKVKVLDFGLAKAYAGDAAVMLSGDVAQSPTLTTSGTRAGMILGTAAYMAPEQARGKPADKRADIWAFGAVLFEMLTGRCVFEGETISDILAATLRQEVDWRLLPPETPARVRQLLRRCLERDPKKRLRDIGELRVVLDDETSGDAGASVTPSPASHGSVARTLVYVPGDSTLGRLAWVERDGRTSPLSDQATSLADPALSPDGERIAMQDRDDTLWTMDLRRGTRVRLTHDGEGTNAYAVWSRDGTHVAFASNRSGDWEMYSVPAGGGAATRLLAREGNQFPLSYAPDGTLLFNERVAGRAGADLWTLAPGGAVAPFLIDQPASKAGGQFSPDARAVAYISDETGRDEVYVRLFGVKSDAVQVSTDGGIAPRWSADGRELFFRWAMRSWLRA